MSPIISPDPYTMVSVYHWDSQRVRIDQHDSVDSTAEKAGRASLFGAVMRSLGPDTITICDNLNYIKGFRYQMYCAARESHARVCTVSKVFKLAGETELK